MRDPMTMAYSIKRPWPEIRLRRSSPVDDAKGWFHWSMRLFKKRRYISPFILIGRYELYFPDIVEVWHKDPLGDVGPPCHGRKYWKLHVGHLSISWTFWHRFVQRHVTKCAWCGNTSNKEQGLVNHTTGHMRCHSKCLSEYIDRMHDHNPNECYTCMQKTLPEITVLMPLDQRELLDSLRVQIDLGLVDRQAAVATYNRKKLQKQAAAWK